MRAVSLLIAVFVTTACSRIHFGYDAEDMRQGKLIADHLKVIDADLKVAWISQGGPVMEMYGVTGTDRQNAILARIREMKATGLINRKVRVCFYELQTVVTWQKKGAGYSLSPKKLIREATL